jgi:hypothetical protein
VPIKKGANLLHELFAIAGDIRVFGSDASNSRRQAICQVLDQTATVFPGSCLRMRFAPPISLPRLPVRTERRYGLPRPLNAAQTGHFGATLCQKV